MSQATRAKGARARATIAANILKKTPERDHFGRDFDDCFEMGDGDEVYSHLITRAVNDTELERAIATHGFTKWVNDIHARRQQQPPLFPLAPQTENAS